MKRIIAVVLTFIIALSLCACESKQERANRKIREANEAYERGVQELDDLEAQLEHVRRQIEQAEENK